MRAVLDCTGGWFTEQEWGGVPLSALGLRHGTSIDVVSTTGYCRRFPAREAGTLLLATHASGRPLSAGHGGPARIVAPGRRGFCWVKWVASIEVSRRAVVVAATIPPAMTLIVAAGSANYSGVTPFARCRGRFRS